MLRIGTTVLVPIVILSNFKLHSEFFFLRQSVAIVFPFTYKMMYLSMYVSSRGDCGSADSTVNSVDTNLVTL